MKSLRWFQVALLALAVLATAAASGCKKEEAPPTAAPPAARSPGTAAPPPVLPQDMSPITGKALSEAGSPVAVSIDNHSSARPQTGLNEADIVYEALAEGGITRYLAVFHSRAPETVGPVRSARPYFALLAKEWGAVFGHCGGDPKDIQPIRDWNVVDGDEFRYGHLYWRDKTRSAPHNLYTSVANLREVTSEPLPNPEKRYEFTEWAESPEAGLEIRYNRNYAVRYEYSDKCYNRHVLEKSEAPLLHVDRETEEPVEAANIIVQFAHSEVVYSDGGLVIDLIGKGKAVFLLGGAYSEGSWEKTALDQPTIFYNGDRERISIARGQTWVQIVPEDASVKRILGR